MTCPDCHVSCLGPVDRPPHVVLCERHASHDELCRRVRILVQHLMTMRAEGLLDETHPLVRDVDEQIHRVMQVVNR